MKKFLVSIATVSMILCSCNNEPKVGIVAHRGFWDCEEAGFSENTIASLRAAQEAGFWGSEFDVQLTSDNVPIVNHNKDIQGYAIKDYPLDTLKTLVLKNGENPSTLDEYLTQGETCTSTKLVIELKDQKDTLRNDILLDSSVEILKNHKLFDPERVVFITFSLYMCERIAREYPEFTNQYLNGDLKPLEAKEKGINGIDYDQIIFEANPSYISEASENGMSVNVWTVNEDSTMVAFIEKGVGFITTNQPLALRRILKKKELK